MEFTKRWKILAVGVLKGIFLGMVIPCYAVYKFIATTKNEKPSIVFTILIGLHGILTVIVITAFLNDVFPAYQEAIYNVPKHGGIGGLAFSMTLIAVLLALVINAILNLIIGIYLFYKCSTLTSEKEIFNQGIIIGSLFYNLPFAAVFYGKFLMVPLYGVGIFFLFAMFIFLFGLSGLRNIWKILLVAVWVGVYFTLCHFFFSIEQPVSFYSCLACFTCLNLILGLLLKQSDGVWKYQRKTETQ